jgi:ketosteroid isomerase-like protein
MAADRAFSDSGARDLSHAFASFAAPDGAMLGSGAEMVWGPDEIASVFKEWPANRRLVWHPVQAGVASSGDLAFTVGEAETLALDQPGTPAIAKSKYLTIWRKQADGTWKYVVDGGNARP